MTYKLKKAEFVEWLDGLDPKSRPATCADATKCILARFVAEKTDLPGRVEVDGYRYAQGVPKGTGKRFEASDYQDVAVVLVLPQWAQDVAQTFDGLDTVPFTQHHARPTVEAIREAIKL